MIDIEYWEKQIKNSKGGIAKWTDEQIRIELIKVKKEIIEMEKYKQSNNKKHKEEGYLKDAIEEELSNEVIRNNR